MQYSWYTGLASLTIFTIYFFTIEQRKKIFYLIGLSSFAVLIYFSTTAITSGVAVSQIAQVGGYSVAAFKDYNVFTFSLMTPGYLPAAV